MMVVVLMMVCACNASYIDRHIDQAWGTSTIGCYFASHSVWETEEQQIFSLSNPDTSGNGIAAISE